MQYYEATGDTSAIECAEKYFRYLHDSHLTGRIRSGGEYEPWKMLLQVTGLYRQTKEPWILETIESIQKNSSDWTSYYEKFPWDSAASADKKIPLELGYRTG